MNGIFSENSPKILIVDASGANRQLLSELLKAKGYESSQGLAAIADVIEFLETDTADWIIAPLGSGETNLLGLLRLITVVPQLKSIRISMLVDQGEEAYLSHAFELGLLSYFHKPLTKESFSGELDDFLARLEKCDYDETRLAASYLREYLKRTELYPPWIALEKKLLELFPGSSSQLLHLAEPQFLSGDKNKAKNTLKQALLLDESLRTEVEAFEKQYLADEDLEDNASNEEGSPLNVLGIEDVVIVDSDDTIQNALNDIFTEAGLKKVESFSDGESAAEYIKSNPNPGLIIQEWRIPKLTGPVFLQRIISEGASSSPVIVLSSLLQAQDIPLVKEMGVANVIKKPFDKSEFLKSLVWTLQQDRMPSEFSTLERKIRNALRAKDHGLAQQLIEKVLKKHGSAPAKTKLLEAELAYHQREYEKTQTLCIESIKLAGDSIFSLNLLGKALMRLQQFDSALKCLKKAQELSPLNVERLCQIAEVQTELGDHESAKTSIDQAKDLDQNSKTIQNAEINVALTSGDTKKAKELMHQLESLDDIISYMNNKAIALARCEKFDEGINEYKKTIAALPDNRADIASLVHYNLALAYARASELEDALSKCQLALETPNKRIQAKAKSLKRRLKQALDTGEDFHLIATKQGSQNASENGSSTPSNNSAIEQHETPSTEGSDVSEILMPVDEVLAKQGDICCYLLYHYPQAQTTESKQLASKLPRFKMRQAIEREETLKAESHLKKAS